MMLPAPYKPALNSARMPSPTPSPPILVTMAGARPSRAAAVRALPQLPPPCRSGCKVSRSHCQLASDCKTRQRGSHPGVITLAVAMLCPAPTCASNCSVRSLSSGRGKAATCRFLSR